MVRCIHLPFIVLLITWRKQGILGSDVNLNVEGTTCVGNNITLGCTIDPFTTIPSATWSRNGPTALTTCTSGGSCTKDDLTINSVTYYFSGNTTGIFASFQIQRIENEIEWICNHNATPYRYTFEVPQTCKSDDNSNGKTLKIVAGVLGGVGGAGAAAGLVVGGSKLVKKQASVKNSEEDKSNKNSKEDESKKDSKKRKSKKTNADDVEGGRSAAAADSTSIKAVGNMETENLKNQNSTEENQKVEYINEERLKNTHSDKDTRKEKPNDSSFNFAVGERGPPPNPQFPPARLEPLKPKKEKSKREKKDAEENSNN